MQELFQVGPNIYQINLRESAFYKGFCFNHIS